MEVNTKQRSAFSGIPRVPTGVFGLDDIIEGGFEKNSLNIVAGETGSGKTLFAFQFAYMGAYKYNDSSLFISFEETKEELRRRMGRFGFDINGMEAKGKLLLYNYSPKEINKFAEELPQIETQIKKNKITRISIDSVSTFALFFESESRKRQELIALIDKFRKLDATVVMSSELKMLPQSNEAEESFTFEYLADSIIALYSTRKSDVRNLGLEIVKMRGTNHSRKLNPMRIVPSGMIVYPDMPFTQSSNQK